MKKIIVIGVTAFAVIFFSVLSLLLHTQSGLRLLSSAGSSVMPGLTIDSVQGRLSGPMQIRNIQYISEGSSYTIHEVSLDWKLSRLFLLEAHIMRLHIDGISIVTAKQEEQVEKKEEATELPDITFPLKVILRDVLVSNISVTEEGADQPLIIHKVAVRGSAGPRSVRIRQFNIDMPELVLAVKGTVSPQDSYPMDISASWKVRMPGYEEIAGQGNISGDMALLSVKQDITVPFQCKVMAEIKDVIENIRWEGSISLDAFTISGLNKSWPDLSVAGEIKSGGSATYAEISSFSVHAFDGTVSGSGSVGWAPALTWSMQLSGSGLNPGLIAHQWPGTLAVSVLSKGELTGDQFYVKPSEVSVDGVLRDRQVSLKTTVSASESEIELSSFHLSSGESLISASGKLDDQWSFAWEAGIADASDLMPGLSGDIKGQGTVSGGRSYPAIQGVLAAKGLIYENFSVDSINADVSVHTKDDQESRLDVTAEKIDMGDDMVDHLKISLKGTQDAHLLSATGSKGPASLDLQLTGGYSDSTWAGTIQNIALILDKSSSWVLGERADVFATHNSAGLDLLCMKSNESKVCLKGEWGSSEGVMGNMSLSSFPIEVITPFLPDPFQAEGRLNSDAEVSYKPDGSVTGRLSLIIPSARLRYDSGDIPIDLSLEDSRVEALLSDEALDTRLDIVLPGRGNIKSHLNLPYFKPGISDIANQTILGHVDALLDIADLLPLVVPQVSRSHGSLSVNLKLQGTLADKAVTGEVILQEAMAEVPHLGLKVEGVSVSLKGNESHWISINSHVSDINLTLPSSVTMDGSIKAAGDVQLTSAEKFLGNLAIKLPSGNIRYLENDRDILIPIGVSEVVIALDAGALDGKVDILFPDMGRIQGDVTLPGYDPVASDTKSQKISGKAELMLSNLDLVHAFVPKVTKAHGSVSGEAQVRGTLSETNVTGRLKLKDGGADLPDLGLKLREINISLKGDEQQNLTIEGSVSSGEGNASLNGVVGLDSNKPTSAAIHLKGQSFDVIKIPGTWITVSPDVAVNIQDNLITFSGSMLIPHALLEPPDISGAVMPSKDVVVTDMPAKEKETKWSQSGKFKLSLGEDVRFSGYGLTCRITGGIELIEQPGKVTQGQGEFQIVEGKYKAYGQDLIIEKGRLIFAGLLNDPGLDIRASRTIKDVKAGVIVQGTLKTPTFQIYSVPAMDESDALSYILFGRPMNQLSGSEGGSLYSTALSAGLSAGGLAAKKIGSAFGVEEVELEKGDAPDQATLFVGKYLSPRLYLNYGIGLFEPVSIIRLRYDLTESVEVQTEYGIESGGDVFYTIER